MIGLSMDWLNLDGYGPVLSSLLRTNLAATWFGAIVVVICLMAGRWIGPHQRSWLWLIVAIRLALPVAPEFAGSLQPRWFSEIPRSSSTNHDATLAVVTHAAEAWRPEPYTADPYSESRRVPSFNEWVRQCVLLLWFAGIIVCAGWILWTIARCRSRLRGLSSTADPRLIAILESCRELLRLRRRVRLLILPALHSPALTGIFRPRILLPEDVARDFSDDEIRQILLHEMVHVRRNDLAINAFLSLMQVMHWWNPTFWFVRSRLLRERELSCDESVVRVLGAGQASSYGHTLIRIVERLSNAARETWKPGMEGIMLVSIVGRTSVIKARLRRLPRAARPVRRATRLFAWGIVILCTVAGLTDAQQQDLAEATKNASSQLVLPASAQFHLAIDENNPSKNDESSEKLTVQTYPVKDLLDRMQREQGLNLEGARKELTQLIATYALLIEDSSHNSGGRTQSDHNQENLVRVLKDYSLVVRATARVHKRVRELIEIRRIHGFQNITFEVKWLELPVDLNDALSITGGEIYSTLASGSDSSAFDELAAETEAANVLRPLQGRSKTTITAPMPVYMKLLDSSTTERVVQFTQAHERSNILFAPKVSAFAGQEVKIRDELVRMFVVGLRSNDASQSVRPLESWAQGVSPSADSAAQQQHPEIMQASDGWMLRIMGFKRNGTDRIHVRCELTESKITDVAEGLVGQGPGQPPLKIQIPSVMRHVCSAAANITPGETLLLHPIESSTEPGKDSAGKQRRYLLIKPDLTSP